jgi:dihydrofolate synthase / folylpolyglutamate synthase
MLASVYQPEGYDANYPAMLRHVNNINSKLRNEGILAPSESSLQNTLTLYNAIGRPLDRIPTIHVGGTNGKGSTSFKIAAALQANGIRTGLFVSPHLASFRERAQVNAELIPEDDFIRHMATVCQLCVEHGIPATVFELAFLLACRHFEATGCEAVVLEVGLGGEADATNVVNTMLSVICSVSLDHTRILGSTVEQIGRVKAGIFKSNIHAIAGPEVPVSVLQEVATTRGALLHLYEEVCQEISSHLGGSLQDGILAEGDVTSSSIADTDRLNATIALGALWLLKTRLATSVSSVFSRLEPLNESTRRALELRPPCRWEIHNVDVKVLNSPRSSAEAGESIPQLDSEHRLVPVQVILDVGHNPAAVGALTRRIRRDLADRKVRILYAVSRDKDVRKCINIISAAAAPGCIHFAQSDNFRAVSKSDLAAIFRQETGHDLVDIEAATTMEAIQLLLTMAASESDISTIVICGTGYIMPDARQACGIIEPRDDRVI